jgi:hypothetical protein
MDQRPAFIYPDIHRVGHAWFVAQGIGKKMLRAVHLRSFSFYLAFWPPSEQRAEIDYFSKTFMERNPAAVLLRASRRRETLVCDGTNAWDSISEARNILFVWNTYDR